MIIYLSEQEYEAERHIKAWYEPFFKQRAFVRGDTIYVNSNAFFLNELDKQLLIAHEEGHIQGRNHELLGVMSDNGFIRYLSGVI